MSVNLTVGLVVLPVLSGSSVRDSQLAAEIGGLNRETLRLRSARCLEEAVRSVLAADSAAVPYWVPPTSFEAPAGFNRLVPEAGTLSTQIGRIYADLLQLHRAVLFVGCDFPQISPSVLGGLVSMLRSEKNALIIGPSVQGGALTFGSGITIPDASWEEAELDSPRAAEKLECALRGRGRFERLVPATAIHTQSDIDELLLEWSAAPPLLNSQQGLQRWLQSIRTADGQAPRSAATISIVIPALHEEVALGATIESVLSVPNVLEVIVVDGGSTDGTVREAIARGAEVVVAPRGRGSQLRTGAMLAQGDILLFLHADTIACGRAIEMMHGALSDSEVIGGTFRPTFSGTTRSARFLTWLYPHLRYLGLSYGDAGMFVQRDAYYRSGGFRPLPIFEDLDFISRLKRSGKFVRLDGSFITSSRRFEGRSFTKIFAWWTFLQILYWLKVPPARLAPLYKNVRSVSS